MKTCYRCVCDKPQSEFYAHKGNADGLLGKCKECTKADASKHRAANLDKVRQYDRDRGRTPEKRTLNAKANAKILARDPRRKKCYDAVKHAVARGRLVPMRCERCTSAKTVAHHESYDRPLVVRWFCQIHHKERHKQMKLEGITP